MTLKFLARLIESNAALLVTLCSSLLVWPVRRVRFLNLVAAVAIPAVLAYCVYWLPVWLLPPDLNNDNDLHRLDMHAAWAALGEAQLFFPAVLVSLGIVAVTWFRALKRNAADSSRERTVGRVRTQSKAGPDA